MGKDKTRLIVLRNFYKSPLGCGELPPAVVYVVPRAVAFRRFWVCGVLFFLLKPQGGSSPHPRGDLASISLGRFGIGCALASRAQWGRFGIGLRAGFARAMGAVRDWVARWLRARNGGASGWVCSRAAREQIWDVARSRFFLGSGLGALERFGVGRSSAKARFFG